MAKFWMADIPAFLDDFGEVVSWNNGSEVRNVRGIFDNEYSRVDVLESGVESRGPEIAIASADIVGVAQGQTITVDNGDGTTTAYNVMAVEPDGTGITRLLLSKD